MSAMNDEPYDHEEEDVLDDYPRQADLDEEDAMREEIEHGRSLGMYNS